jgi:hypothetical protein
MERPHRLHPGLGLLGIAIAVRKKQVVR